MDQLKVGWIGFGNMAKAMAQGLIGSGRIAPDALYACARDQKKLQDNTATLGMHACPDARTLVEAVDLVIVAVKPYQVHDVLMPLRDALSDKIVLSVAAGMPFAAYEELLGRAARIFPRCPIRRSRRRQASWSVRSVIR